MKTNTNARIITISKKNLINEWEIYKYLPQPFNVSKMQQYIMQANKRWALKRETLERAKSLIEKQNKLKEIVLEMGTERAILKKEVSIYNPKKSI